MPPPIETANERILDAYVARSVEVERFARGEVAAILSIVDERWFPQLAEALERRLLRLRSRGNFARIRGQKQYRALIDDVRGRMTGALTAARDALKRDLRRLATQEVTFAMSVLGRQFDFAVPLHRPGAASIARLVTSEPYLGGTLAQHFEGVRRLAVQTIEREIVTGLVGGERADQIARRVRGPVREVRRGTFSRVRQWLETEVRTSVNAVRSGADGLVATENKERVRREQWIAALEGSCVVCLTLHGQTFAAGEGPRPPEHPRCRCVRVPVLASARALGLQPGDLPELTRAGLQGEEPIAIDAHTWFLRQTTKEQAAMIGATKAKAVRDGVLHFNQREVLDHALRPLRLDEIEARLGRELARP